MRQLEVQAQEYGHGDVVRSDSDASVAGSLGGRGTLRRTCSSSRWIWRWRDRDIVKARIPQNLWA